MTAVGGVYLGESDASDTVETTAMKPPVIRSARPGDAADLARNWIDAARHYADLDSDAFQVPAVDGLAAWFEELLLRPRSADALWLVAELDGRVIGDVSARLERPVEGAVRAVLTTYHASPLSVPFYEQGMGYERRSIVFEKRLE